MRVFAAVPVKPPLMAKTRLSSVLSAEERRLFTSFMVEDVLTALKSSKVYRVVVISSDNEIGALAKRFGVSYLMESMSGLNHAVLQANEWCLQNKAESVMILSADIPRIISMDINRIVELADNEAFMVISPSRNGGTNALLQLASSLICPRFGSGSFMKHVNEAATKEVPYRIYYSERVAFDIDSLEDLRSYLGVECGTRSRRFLEEIRLAHRIVEP